VLKNKIWANFQIIQRIIELFTKKIVKKLLKIWSWDPESEIRDPEKPIPDPGSRGQKAPDPGSGSPTLFISDPGFLIQDLGSGFFHSGSRMRIRNTELTKNFSIFYIVRVLSGAEMLIPDLGSRIRILAIQNAGSRV
jgi:hypothetical protein